MFMNPNVSNYNFDVAYPSQSELAYATGSLNSNLDSASIEKDSLDSLQSNILILEMLKVDIKNYITERDNLGE